jgi:hypothetical protein
MTKINWKELIQNNKDKLEEKIIEQWKLQLDEPVTSSMRAVVLLWEDGDITTVYRDQNSWSIGEHNGTAICVASFGSTMDESINDFEDVEEYKRFMLSEYPPDVDRIIDNVIKETD